MDYSMREGQASIAWYIYIFEPAYIKYKGSIDGDFRSRIWWFKLKEVL